MNKQLVYKTTRNLFRFVSVAGLLLAAPAQAESRWYEQAMVDEGNKLFQQNCAVCHGANAEGTTDWKKTDANGNFPPPPLDGTAHAWHHNKELLARTIRNGGASLGGQMPGFADKLSAREIEAVIAYFQSKWPDDVYQKWASANKAGDMPDISNIVETLKSASSGNDMTALLRKRLGSDNVAEPVPTPVEGVYEIRFGSKIGYISQDGRYLFMGDLIDLKYGQNVTSSVKRNIAIAEIAKYAVDDRAIFPADGEEKAVLSVFTDTSCPYCQKLHSEISRLQAAGISVHYLPYPRGGERGPGYQTLKQVWCAKDRAQAMTIAKGQETGDLPSAECETARLVDDGHALGNRVGVTGTPALFLSNGENIMGYVPYQELIPRILEN